MAYPETIPPGRFKLTYEEYAELPNDGKRYEIIDGDLYVNPAPVPKHQKVSRRLQLCLMLQLEEKGLGEVFNAPIDVVLDKHTIVQPDLIFIRKDRLEELVGSKYIQGPPDLVVEILSPSSRRSDVLLKSRTYASFGVHSYWIADPDIDRLELFTLDNAGYMLQQQANAPDIVEPKDFSGLRVDLSDVFR
jgi:Uma2 family endonuclease